MPVHSNLLSQCSNASSFVAISDALVVIVCVIMPNNKFVYHQLFSSNMMCHLCAEYELSRSDCIFITVRNEVAKVMFLQACVCPQGGST